MRNSSGFGWIDRFEACLLGAALLACLLGLALLASCAGNDDSGQAQSFNAHLNGSYTAAAVSTAVH